MEFRLVGRRNNAKGIQEKGEVFVELGLKDNGWEWRIFLRSGSNK